MPHKYIVNIPNRCKLEIINIIQTNLYHNKTKKQWYEKHIEDDITLWLNKNCDKYHWLFTDDTIRITFLKMEDALAFKLKWL